MALSIETFVGLAVVLFLLYHYLTRNFDYWEKRHVVGPKPILLFGTFKDVILKRMHAADYIKSIYDAYYNEPVVGLFVRNKPELLARDPEIIKEVLIKHFTAFSNRSAKIHEDIDPLSQNLVYLKYERWRTMRKKLTPTFSSGKLKDMFYLSNECTENFVDYMTQLASKNDIVECRELTAKFMTDAIGVCVFGLNMNSLSDEDSEFRKIGRSIFSDTWHNKARYGIRHLPHWMAMLLKPIARNDKIINFFVDLVTNTMKHRKENNIRRNDFIDLLMDLKDNANEIGDEEMTDILLTAQAFVFFAAGFETSSTAMSHALYELALHPHIQDTLRQEIKTTLDENDGKLSYDHIKNMKYLDKVMKETLRKHAPGFVLAREATSDHTFAESKISIEKGTRVLIPVYAIHYDPNIYPNPEQFDPERFDEEVASSRPHMSYLPFGDGPRNCIGERFAKNQTKLGLITAIKNFQFDICEKTFKVYKKRINARILLPEGDIYLKIKKL